MRWLFNKLISKFTKKKKRTEYLSFDEENLYDEAIDRYHSLMLDLSYTKLQKEILSCIHTGNLSSKGFTILQVYKCLKNKSYSCSEIKDSIHGLMLKNILGKSKKSNYSLHFNNYYLILT